MKRRLGNTALEVDTLGFGCASLGNLYRTVSPAEATAVLDTAWSEGFRFFDTAPHYGQGLSERRIGDFLRDHPNDHYVLSTKVGRLLQPAGYQDERHGFKSPMPFDIAYDYSYDGIMRSFEDSLQRLGLDRIDILYMHDIGAYTHGDDSDRLFSIAMRDGYRAMDELRSAGLIGAIGLGVNEYQVCEAALDHGDWDCFLLAGRYTLLEQDAAKTFLPACQQRNCSVVIGGVYNSGILASGVKGQGPWHYDYAAAPESIVDRVAAIETLCDEFDIPLAAAALQFPLAHPAVASVIPGIGQVKRIKQTLELFETKIPAEFWRALVDAALLDDGVPTPASS
jgi:D-threo-aldose 1-dehydrogenase